MGLVEHQKYCSPELHLGVIVVVLQVLVSGEKVVWVKCFDTFVPISKCFRQSQMLKTCSENLNYI